MENQKLIVLKNIVKEFQNGENSVRVLDDINLEIQKGEFIAIIGASGSGKSTLMNILGCLDTPSEGDYFVNGQPVKNLHTDELAKLRREHFGFIFQKYHLINSVNALSNIEIPAIYAGTNKQDRHKRALELLGYLGLEGKGHHKPNQLSGGQQQRVSIARSLMNAGEVILADEPTGALDSKNGLQVMELLKKLHSDGQTIIIVTHDPHIAQQAHRVIEISDGKIIADSVKNQIIYPSKPKPKLASNKSFWNFTSHLSEAFNMAIKSIFSHKLRSFLTMLGIIIGITSVVSIVALGEGSKSKIISEINALGTNTIDIYPGAERGDIKASSIKTLIPRDIDVLSKQPYLDSVSPGLTTTSSILYQSEKVYSIISGVNKEYFRIKAFEIEDGKLFSQEDLVSQGQVAVIDHNLKERLFSDKNPIGEIILAGKVPLKIIGVLEKKESNIKDFDNFYVYVPYTTAMYRIIKTNSFNNITIRVKDDIDTAYAEKEITNLLTRLHETKDFYTFNLDSIKETINKTMFTLTLLISCIAFISLFVGGIGVMNIMLVSVKERTKEIGVKMAIGARQFDIMQQFLIEAVLICFIGGVIGVGLAFLIAHIFNSFNTNFAMEFSYPSIVSAFLCSSIIGIIFGFVPARNAAKLDPIVALSQE